MLQYLEEFLFVKTPHKAINPNTGYQGAVLLAPEGEVPAVLGMSDDELEAPGNVDDEDVLLESDLEAGAGWQPSTPPAGTTEAEYDVAEALSLTPLSNPQTQGQVATTVSLVEQGSRGELSTFRR
ncbi:MAG TPA: hypothetical protein VLN58_13580 [Verrucomicrobiae bacterium]|nr:hypothetical protein [Verrucomicrobiae bacterium]